MSLFVVKHQHKPETCPAKDRQMAPMLLLHLAKENAAKFGITIHGEGVLDGKHTLYLILDAAQEGKVKEFMTPFAMAGSVEIMPASPCERVVDRGEC